MTTLAPYGVNTQWVTQHGVATDNVVNDFPRAGVKVVRFDIQWNYVENRLGAPYNWHSIDMLFDIYARRGIPVQPTIWNAPPEARLYAASKFSPPKPSAYAAWEKFVKTAIGRYGRGGAFWKGKPYKPQPVVAFEYGNEFDGAWFWGAASNPELYAQLYRLTRSAARSVDLGITVLTCGLAGGQKVSITSWLTRFMAANPGTVDAYAVHCYAGKLQPSLDRLASMRRTLDSHPAGKGKPMAVTEVGWSAPGPFFKDDFTPPAPAEENKAEYVAAFLELVGHGVDQVIIHTATNMRTDPQEREQHMNLWLSDGTPLPAVEAFKSVANPPPPIPVLDKAMVLTIDAEHGKLTWHAVAGAKTYTVVEWPIGKPEQKRYFTEVALEFPARQGYRYGGKADIDKAWATEVQWT